MSRINGSELVEHNGEVPTANTLACFAVGFNPDGTGQERDAMNIYQDLALHQRAETWFARDLIEQLQIWSARFIAEFKLDIEEVALRIDKLPCNGYGHFRAGHNGFGLKGEIALNSRYISGRPFWMTLGTLLHELLHAWQHVHGNPSRRDHHNDEFRNKARDCGLNVDHRGSTGYAAWSRFKEILRRYGVTVPEDECVPSGVRIKGNSKLKKWSCGCTNVRCSVSDFQARCLKCGRDFTRLD